NPECPRCKDQTTSALLIKHANRVGEWLNQRGVRSMIWGDMLLGPGEAADAAHAKTLDEGKSVVPASRRRSRLWIGIMRRKQTRAAWKSFDAMASTSLQPHFIVRTTFTISRKPRCRQEWKVCYRRRGWAISLMSERCEANCGSLRPSCLRRSTR